MNKFIFISLFIITIHVGSCKSSKPIFTWMDSDMIVFKQQWIEIGTSEFLMLKSNNYSESYDGNISVFGKWKKVNDTIFVSPLYEYSYSNGVTDTIKSGRSASIRKFIIHKEYLEDVTDYQISMINQDESYFQKSAFPYYELFRQKTKNKDLRKVIY